MSMRLRNILKWSSVVPLYCSLAIQSMNYMYTSGVEPLQYYITVYRWTHWLSAVCGVQEVQVEFEAREIEEGDFHGIRRLLQQVQCVCVCACVHYRRVRVYRSVRSV